MRQTTATKNITATNEDNVFDFNALLHPGTAFNHPKDVVSDAKLSTAEKRAILASWASDAAAVEPSLAVINEDIEAIGKAQTHLARVMVPYHLDAYAALRPAQQVLYRKLVAGGK